MLHIKSYKVAQFQDLDETEVNPKRPVIDNSNYEDFLADELDQNTEDVSIYESPEELQIVPDGTTLEIPEQSNQIAYNDPFEMVQESLGFNIVTFDYTNRHGTYAGQRTVEPHDWFVAPTTGNHILVGYDLGVRDIRAFIINNIHPGGIRYESSIVPDRSFRNI